MKGFEKCYLAPHARILRSVDVGEGRRHLLGHQDIGLAVTLGGRQHQGMWWRAQIAVDDIELETGRPASEESKIPYPFLVADALEDEGGAGVEATGLSKVVGRDLEALSDEADSDQQLGRPAVAAPETAVFAGEGPVVLTRLGGPVADPV